MSLRRWRGCLPARHRRDGVHAEETMRPIHPPPAVLAAALTSALLLSFAGPLRAADAAAAQALAKRSNCFKCHAIDKAKEAKPWKEVAAKLKGKADAQEKLIKHITTGPKVKLDDLSLIHISEPTRPY